MDLYCNFVAQPRSVCVKGKGAGTFNAFKITSIMKGCTRVSVSNSHYYYVPYLKSVVSLGSGGSRGSIMSTTNGHLNFKEKDNRGFARPFKAIFSDVIESFNMSFKEEV